jgi:hypothetical protein
MATEIYPAPQLLVGTKIYRPPTDATGTTIYEDPTDILFLGDLQTVGYVPTIVVA